MAVETLPAGVAHARRGPAGSSGRGTLVVVLLGFLMLPMSMSGASVAVPRIGAELEASGTASQWVVTAYFLTASAFMLVAGSLGDALGRRRIYRLGALTYAVGSLLAAMAPSIAVLLAARVITGLGAAGVMAGGGALLGSTFTGRARTRAFAAMGTISGIGLALGPTLSGQLVDGLGWRLGFGVFLVPGLVLAAGTLLMHETRAGGRPRLDLGGAALFVTGLTALLLAVTRGSAGTWFSQPVLMLAGGAALLLTGFVVVERRARHPILDLALLRRRRFMGWLLAATTMGAGFAGVLNFLPSYLQDPVGLAPSDAGLAMMLPTVPMMILPPVAGRVVSRGAPPATVIISALLGIAGGNAWLTVLGPEISLTALAAPLVLLGVGVGLAAGTIDAQAMNAVDDDQVGMAAGMLNTVRSTTNALILGVFGSALIALVTARTGSAELAGRIATGNIPGGDGAAWAADQLTEAWRIVLFVLAGCCGAAALAVAVLVRRGREARSAALPSLSGHE